jgi:hypothetical protein
MTDAQTIVYAAVTVFAVIAGSVFTDIRIRAFNASVIRSLDECEVDLKANFELHTAGLRADMDALISRIDAKLDRIIAMVGNLDTRLARLAERPY